MHDQPDVAADPHRPEVLVLAPCRAYGTHAGIGRVELQVERRRLDGFLLVAGQSGEAVGEGVGDAEFHQAASQRLRIGTANSRSPNGTVAFAVVQYYTRRKAFSGNLLQLAQPTEVTRRYRGSGFDLDAGHALPAAFQHRSTSTPSLSRK